VRKERKERRRELRGAGNSSPCMQSSQARDGARENVRERTKKMCEKREDATERRKKRDE
jgi:hypothetical protein